MSLEIPTWDTISGPQNSTTSEFGGHWGNLISEYYNDTNIGLIDASKIPIIGTITKYKYEKLALFDPDASHYVIFSVDDIDTGPTRKIKFRRMNTPYEQDYVLMEGLPQTILNKTIDSTVNTITNIANANIKTGAAIAYSKLNLSASIQGTDLATNSVIGTNIQDGSVTLAKLAADSVDSSKILNNSIVNADVNTSAAIAYSKLALTNSIVAGDITSDAVTTIKILNANVTLAKMAANSVDSSKIVDDSIVNGDINSAAAIVTSKLADSANFLLKTLDNNLGTYFLDMTRMTAPANPATNDVRIYTKQIDTNNDGLFCKVKKATGFVEVQIL